MRRAFIQDGSITLVAASLLILMASVAAGGALILQAALFNTQRSADRDRVRNRLRQHADRVIELLTGDPTPGSDSPLDPVWSELMNRRDSGIGVSLQDMSSRLNPNWVQKAILQKTGLGELLSPGRSAEELQQRREDEGISTDIAAEYGDLIKEDALRRCFSGFSYANLNTTDEFALRKLYAIRTGDAAGAEVFRTHWQQAMIQKKSLKRTDLKQFLGLDYETLFPVMNVEPTFNVHFLEPLVLSALVSFPDFKIANPRQAAQGILDSRAGVELTSASLRRIVGAPEDNGVFQYLGVVTWFWKISVSLEASRLEVVVARLPSDDESPPRFQKIEERYMP